MSRLPIIIKREYVQMVCKKSFIFTTILVPILSIVLCGVLPVLMSQAKSDERKLVAVVDQSDDARFASCIVDDEDYIFQSISAPKDTTADMHKLYQESEQSLYALVVIPSDLIQNTKVSIFSEKSVNGSLERSVARSLRKAVREERIKAYAIDSLEYIIKDCDPEVQTTNIKWSKEGDESISSSELSMILGLVLALLTYMFVIIYGAMIMNSVVEEKTNRIVEVIISTCKPFELMMGKIIGVALVGLTQIVLWTAILSIVGAVFGISTMSTTMTDMSTIQAQNAEALAAMQNDNGLSQIVQMILNVNYAQILSCFVLYFIGGYLLYASLFAAFGSAVDQASDASQFTAPIMMIMVFALYAGMFSMENPDGPLAFWCSMIPFTSPVVMMIRLPYDLPWYELAGSVLLLYGTALGIMWISSRIYRTGILMYGRKFTFKEIIRWIK